VKLKVFLLPLFLSGWVTAPAAVSGQSAAGPDRSAWFWELSSGFDGYLHSYPLAVTDTTETISEFMVQTSVEGRSARRSDHRWRVRGEVSLGTELWRERFAGAYRWLDSEGTTRLRLRGTLWGRQYRNRTEYTLSSDNYEGRLEARGYPLAGRGSLWGLRAWADLLDYRTPSTLEVNHREQGVGLLARSRELGTTMWVVGLRLARRAYPDTSSLDRRVVSLEGDFEHQDPAGQGVRIFHKTDRRLVEDAIARPASWAHWSDFDGAVTAGGGQIFLDLQSEVWDYDSQQGAFFDSWRIESHLGFRWGDILAAIWRLGPAFERLDAGDSPETYSQFGLRGGVESYGSAVNGSVTLEYGRRVYRNGVLQLETDLEPTLPSDLDTMVLYTDFNYWQIWLMAGWTLSAHWRVDLLASYEPESHTERTDDSALGFASLRLIWRP
jgi:hypothetical protein